MDKNQEKLQLKKWEKVLITFSFCVSIASVFLYVSGLPVQFFLKNVFEIELKEVGKVQEKTGTLRQQIAGDVVFQTVEKLTPVHNQDILVTSEEGAATIVFEDGSSFDMGASSMIQISYETELTLSGIVRAPQVKVVKGRVTAKTLGSRISFKTKTRTVLVPANSKEIIAAVNEPEEVKASPTPEVSPSPSPTMTVSETSTPTPSPSISETPTPSPSPSPTQTQTYVAEEMTVTKLRLSSPSDGEKLKISDGSKIAEKVVNFKWNISPPNTKILLTIWKLESGGKKEVFKTIARPNKGFGSYQWTAKNPGVYEWQLGEEVSPIPTRIKRKNSFTILPDFQSIEAQDPLVGGKKIASNTLQDKALKNFDIVFKWSRFPNVKKYKILVSNSETSKKVLLEREVTETEYHFNKGKVYDGKVFFKVIAELENGFIVESKYKPFVFNFLPPILVVPDNKTIIAMGSIAGVGKGILITWQKTNFTENYEIEIAQDLEFKNIIFKKKLVENYLIFKPEKAGKYWWRTRSYATNIPSPMSEPFEFTVTP